MAKTKKKLTNEEKLAKDRLRKKEKYIKIKNDPELYAIQKEKERKRYLLRKELNKICSIKNMTQRAQREQRKRWRHNSKQYLKKKEEAKKIERIIIENFQPDSEIENIENNINNNQNVIQDPLESETGREQIKKPCLPSNYKMLTRKLHYRYQKIIKKLKDEILRLKKENYNLKRKQPIDTILNDSIQKKVNEIVRDINSDKVEEIKKKLLFGEAVSKNLKEEYKSLSKKDKRSFAEQVIKDRERFKKYRVLKNLPFSSRSKVLKQDSISNELSDKIASFFEEDCNTSIAAGKKEYIKRKGLKKQKRYLSDTMKNLHAKFITEVFRVSYSTFCKYRPFWVLSPKARDTCQCKIHANVDLLIAALKRANIINESSSSEILKTICCRATDENCLDRSCELCATKTLAYKEFENDKMIFFYEWLTEKQSYKCKDGLMKQTNITTKKKQHDFPRNVILKLESILPQFSQHVCNIVMQYESIKELKCNLKYDEVLIHIDFSENYCLKYNEEIQSFHFGGSRGQVSLHTGVLYYHDIHKNAIETKSFCTVSQCLNHDAAAVWTHLKPILNMAKNLVPIKAVHFMSDSPTSQYRNKYIFYMITKLKGQLPGIDYITWNYQEAGHGKGAPDGIGAVMKRTADSYVKNGGDVGSFEKFVEVVSVVKNVTIEVIEEAKFKDTKFPPDIPTFKGTMKVHQVVWSTSLPHSVALRSRSCFICRDSYVPCGHGKHLGVLNIGIDSTSTCSSNTYNFVEASDLNIDSPTICNNISSINDTVLLNEIDQYLFLHDAHPITDSRDLTVQTPKLQILSNVTIQPFDSHHCYTYNKNKMKAFNPTDQLEFENFINNTDFTNTHNYNENRPIENEIECFDTNTNIKKEFKEDSKENKDTNNSNKENEFNYSFNLDDWVTVQYQIKSKIYAYIGKVKEIAADTYTIIFLRKVKANIFSWPEVVDEDVVSKERILCTLSSPEINRRGQFLFSNLPNLCFR